MTHNLPSARLGNALTFCSTLPSDLQNNNVNLNEQMVSLINEKNYFTFNVKGLKVADDMLGSLLNVKA